MSQEVIVEREIQHRTRGMTSSNYKHCIAYWCVTAFIIHTGLPLVPYHMGHLVFHAKIIRPNTALKVAHLRLHYITFNLSFILK
jgi:hypothetical protein